MSILLNNKQTIFEQNVKQQYYKATYSKTMRIAFPVIQTLVNNPSFAKGTVQRYTSAKDLLIVGEEEI